MSFRIKGNAAQLQSFQRGLLGVGRGLEAAAGQIADRAQVLLDVGFGTRRDPYGKKWKRRKRAYPWPLLERFGDLRGSIKAMSVRRSIRITFTAPHGVYHQGSRPFIPDGRGIPPRWMGDFKKIVILNMRKQFK